jgi:energy-coupling factor transport system permease protein
MNPRAVVAWTAAGIVIVLVSNNPVYRALVVLVAINFLLARKRPDRRLQPLLLMLAVGSVLALLISMALSHAGDHVVATIPPGVPGIGGPITLESAIFGLASGVGITAGALVVAPLSMVLDPHQLVDALPRPLERAGAAIAAALNMVPGVGRSVVAIREAQSMRGWRPRGPRSYAEILVPVVLTSMESSIQLAEAMEARAFGSGGRTRWMPEPWRWGDTLVAVTALLAAVVFVGGRITGLVSDWYPYPSPSLPAVNPVMVAVCLLMLAPLLVRNHD